MKTAISLPDVLYEKAEHVAKDLGIPRSQLVARALEEFITQYNNEDITEKYNAVYASILEGEFENEDCVNLTRLRELTKNDAW